MSRQKDTNMFLLFSTREFVRVFRITARAPCACAPLQDGSSDHHCEFSKENAVSC